MVSVEFHMGHVVVAGLCEAFSACLREIGLMFEMPVEP